MISEKWMQISNGKISNVYLLYGTEAYFIEETIKKLKNKLEEDGEAEVIYFDLEEKILNMSFTRQTHFLFSLRKS